MRINLVSTFSLIVSGALFIGCGDDGGVTTTGATASGSTGEGTGTTGTPGTSTTMTMTTSTTNDTTGTPTTSTTAPETTSTTEPETSTTTTTTTEPGTGTTEEPGTTGEPGSTGGTTGGDDVCAPAPEDDACVMCTKSECCDELKACMMEEACACFVECAQTNPNPIVCLGQCPGVDLMHPFLGCAQDCGCG